MRLSTFEDQAVFCKRKQENGHWPGRPDLWHLGWKVNLMPPVKTERIYAKAAQVSQNKKPFTSRCVHLTPLQLFYRH